MFPPDKKILYVGDPRQRMRQEIDNNNPTITDYEFGKTDSFITDEEHFRNSTNWQGRHLQQETDRILMSEDLSPDDRHWTEELKKLIEKAKEESGDIGKSTQSRTGKKRRQTPEAPMG